MSDQGTDGGTGEHLDPTLGQETTPEVPSGGPESTGSGTDDTGGSSADETSPGSDGDGVEAGYTTPGELVGDPGPVEPTD
ncbi:hypothetical protein [Cellulomonas sp. NS3]|uniref:hypothetical protein n=1 Tax=Cellulomonas sp. NS3 TaxID=2973977 RepID=UPI002163045D|nr:hypothetical protein [Cellulomonas sp. NS3]